MSSPGLLNRRTSFPSAATQAHKAFALAAGLQLLVEALAGTDSYGAVLVVARPESDPVPGFRDESSGAPSTWRPLVASAVSLVEERRKAGIGAQRVEISIGPGE